jgi:dTDP-4-amino-4,6-dideoxygalactose transaminase
MNFDTVTKLEELIAEFYGAPFGVATDCCTHGIELCLRRDNVKQYRSPVHTYISIPFLAAKMGIEFEWNKQDWQDYYYLTDTIVDAAVLWKKGGYISGTFMCLSFQFQKHLSLGRGGMILTDDESAAEELKKMSYDGRRPDVPWREQNITTVGYHYYMTPETAQLGLAKLEAAKDKEPRKWEITDWPDLTQMDIFKTANKK